METLQYARAPEIPSFDTLEKLARLIKFAGIMYILGHILAVSWAVLEARQLYSSMNVGTIPGSPGTGLMFAVSLIVNGFTSMLWGVLIFAAGETLAAFRHLVINSFKQAAAARNSDFGE